MAETTPAYVERMQPRKPFAAPDMPIGTPPLDDRAGGGQSPEDPFSGMTAREPFRLNLEAGAQDQDEQFLKSIEDGSKGRASDVNDLELTMAGILEGDPVGMETFDLGFYEDGTPAVFINGAPVPIESNQWMALMEMRQQGRRRMDEMFKFRVKAQQATAAVNSVVNAMPNMGAGLKQALAYLAQTDPDLAMSEVAKLGTSMAQDGGKTQFVDLSSGIFDSRVKMLDEQYNRRGPDRPVVVQEKGPQGIILASKEVMQPTPSPVDAAILRLQQDGSPEGMAKTSAVQGMRRLMPPPGIKRMTQGQSIGVFDMYSLPASMGGSANSMHPYGPFSMLKSLASATEMWGQAAIQEPPLDPNDPQSVSAYREYLLRLDAFANATLGWDMSNPMAIDRQLEFAVRSRSAQQGQIAPAPAQQGTQQPQNPAEAAAQNAAGGFPMEGL